MTQMKESDAVRLTPARAAELTQVLDLQAQWENLRSQDIGSTAQLQSLQKAFEAYRGCQAAYTARNPSEPVPEMSPTRPARLGIWCRTVRAVMRRTPEGSECPIHVVTKVNRLADQIAERTKTDPAGRESPTDMRTAILQLDTVIAWCDGLETAARPSQAPEVGVAYEVGAGSSVS